jgi:hypothetical protein
MEESAEAIVASENACLLADRLVKGRIFYCKELNGRTRWAWSDSKARRTN